MPKVGKGNKAVHYPYSKKGMKDAMAHSKRTGEPMSIEYGYGGPVKKYPGGGMVKPMYRHGGAVPMSNQNNQNVNMHHNKAQEMDERLKRIVAQQVMGGNSNMRKAPSMRPMYKHGGMVNKPEMTNARQRAQRMLEDLKRYKDYIKGKKKKSPNKKAKK